MHKIILNSIVNNREKFLELHTGDFYGGSEVANISGVGYESPLKVWLRKTGKLKKTESNPQMRFGTHQEPFIANLLEEKLDMIVNLVDQIWQSEDRKWQIASPDAVVIPRVIDNGCETPRIAEFKTHKIYATKYWSETSASDSAICQLQWYLDVCGFDGGYCVALIGGDTDKFFYPFFRRDDALISQLRERVEEFRDFVARDIPPVAGAGDADLIREHLAKPIDAEKVLDLSSDLDLERYADLVSQRAYITPQLKLIDDEIKAIKNELLKKSDGAAMVKCKGGVAKIKEICRAAHEV